MAEYEIDDEPQLPGALRGLIAPCGSRVEYERAMRTLFPAWDSRMYALVRAEVPQEGARGEGFRLQASRRNGESAPKTRPPRGCSSREADRQA